MFVAVAVVCAALGFCCPGARNPSTQRCKKRAGGDREAFTIMVCVCIGVFYLFIVLKSMANMRSADEEGVIEACELNLASGE